MTGQKSNRTAENLGVKFAKWDKRDGYFVPRDCYNSYFYLVEDETKNVLDKFKMSGKQFTQYLDGGSAYHCNLSEHLSKDQYLKMLDAAMVTGCPYFTFNMTSSESKEKVICIKYHDNALTPLEPTTIGDWIDLRSAETVQLKAGEFYLLSLGVSMRLPEGYEAHIAPRSSTFKNWGILQTNSVGVVDQSYCGDNDIWKMPVLATRDTTINFNDRVCQFRIMKKMPKVRFVELAHLEGPDRGGFGSTGKK